MSRSISEMVIAITGASSGIGRATALAIARKGGTALLAARRGAALEDLARQCESAGGRALPIPTDVNDEAAVRRLAALAVERFGRVDAWVNNAAVTVFGRFTDIPPDQFRRVIETNLFGYIHGARAILPHFEAQGGGVLVNVSSVVGKTAQPFASAYVVSKFAVIGLSDCLRQELRDAPGIHVVTVLPAAVDTPLFRQGANHMGRAAKPLPPVYDPHRIAAAILSAIVRPRREIVVGVSARALVLARRLAPGLFDRVAPLLVARGHFQDHPAPPSAGNLFQPTAEEATVTGGWRRPDHSWAAWLALGGLASLALGAACLRRGTRPQLRS